MNHFPIEIDLDSDLVELLWSMHRSHADDYMQWTNVLPLPGKVFEKPNTTKDNLNVLILREPLPKQLKLLAKKFPVKPNKMALFYLSPNAVISPHTDSESYGRNTAVVFPLTTPFVPTIVYENGVRHYTNYPNAYAFSTQIKHGVENGDHERLALQLWFKENCDELKNLMV